MLEEIVQKRTEGNELQQHHDLRAFADADHLHHALVVQLHEDGSLPHEVLHLRRRHVVDHLDGDVARLAARGLVPALEHRAELALTDDGADLDGLAGDVVL